MLNSQNQKQALIH